MLLDVSTMSCLSGENTGLRLADQDAGLAPPLISSVTTGKVLNLARPHLGKTGHALLGSCHL